MGKYWTPTRKGVVNHSHATARNAILEVYKLKGGVQGLWNWVQKDDEHEKIFYSVLLPKLIPAEIADQHGAGDTRIQVIITPAAAPTQAIETKAKPLEVEAGGLCRQEGGPLREPEG